MAEELGLGKVKKKRPAVIELLKSPGPGEAFEVRELNPADCRKVTKFKLALWCDTMKEARAQAKSMNSRDPHGRPSFEPRFTLPEPEGPGAPIKRLEDFKLVASASPTKFYCAMHSYFVPNKQAAASLISSGAQANSRRAIAILGELLGQKLPDTRILAKLRDEFSRGNICGMPSFCRVAKEFGGTTFSFVLGIPLGA